jgi:hypothetical protein
MVQFKNEKPVGRSTRREVKRLRFLLSVAPLYDSVRLGALERAFRPPLSSYRLSRQARDGRKPAFKAAPKTELPTRGNS